MNQTDLLDDASARADALRSSAAQAAQTLRDYSRRLELILSQDHKNIPVRDTQFPVEFAAFCSDLRKRCDAALDYWRQTRGDFRSQAAQRVPVSSLDAKGFALRAKTLSRACDEFTTAYDQFCRFYKNYTLAKLPVWLLTSCCDDLNNLTGKILFLSRELAKRAGLERGC